jgi:hypothetical protein
MGEGERDTITLGCTLLDFVCVCVTLCAMCACLFVFAFCNVMFVCVCTILPVYYLIYTEMDICQCLDKTIDDVPHIGMYPLVAVLGKATGTVKIRHYAAPPAVSTNSTGRVN